MGAELPQRLAAADDAQQDDHDGDDEQNMDEAAYRVGTDQTDQPQNNEYGCNGIEHGISFLICMRDVLVVRHADIHPPLQGTRCAICYPFGIAVSYTHLTLPTTPYV